MAIFYLAVFDEKGEKAVFEFNSPSARRSMVNKLPEGVDYETYQDAIDRKEYIKQWKEKNKARLRRYRKHYMRGYRKEYMRPKLRKRNNRIYKLDKEGIGPVEIARRVGLTYSRVWKILKEHKEKNETNR